MKTAILQCLQQFSSKNKKTLIMTKNLKKLKLQCHLQNFAKPSF